ncbi:MAG: nuclear transport factor 2 family protein [Cyanobacteria bacterium P01_H01_bin.119]
MKTSVKKNLPLLQRLEKLVPHNLASAQDLIADNFVWHYFNPASPEIAGDYVGLSGVQEFFQKLSLLTQGTFKVETDQVIPVGEELLVVHANPITSFIDESFELDAVVVWRIVGDRIAEAWDISSTFASKTSGRADQTPDQLQEAA